MNPLPRVVARSSSRLHTADGARLIALGRSSREAMRLPAGIALLGGAIAATSGAQPTEVQMLDVLLIVAAASGAIWLASAAVWWMPLGVCGIAAISSNDRVLLAVGLVVFAAGMFAAAEGLWPSAVQTMLAGVAVNILIRSEIDAATGVSAVLGLTLCSGLAIAGLVGHGRPVRRLAILGGSTLALFCVLAITFAGLEVASSRSTVADANQATRQGIAELDDGNYLAAAEQFELAAERFASVDTVLNGLLVAPAVTLPVISQNVRAARSLASVASSSLDDVAAALRTIDPASLRLSGGQIDVDALRAAEAPLAAVSRSVDDIRDVVDDADSPWLIAPLTDRLDELEAEFAEQNERLDTAIEAVRLAPGLFGADSERRYLVLFTSPAEARSLGGFIGNYAEVVVDDGQLTISAFGRRSELEGVAFETGATCTECPADFIDRLGRFGFATGPNGGVGPRAWSNLTMSAHFPDVAQVAADLYPDSGGRFVDGVFVMDPYVLEALMHYTGPIAVPQLDVVVQPSEAASFVLEDQYLLAGDGQNDQRIDALGTLGRDVIAQLLMGQLPEPARLADDLAPLVSERRLLAWTRTPAEQTLFDEIGLLGSLPTLSSDGGFSIAVTNGGASKIDAFLSRDTDVDVTSHADGGRRLTATSTLTNGATADDLPRYVNGNAVGLPVGTSRLLVSLYGPHAPEVVRLDGDTIPVDVFSEGGWTVSSTFVNISPGESVEFEAVYRLDAGAVDRASPVRFEQPLAQR